LALTLTGGPPRFAVLARLDDRETPMGLTEILLVALVVLFVVAVVIGVALFVRAGRRASSISSLAQVEVDAARREASELRQRAHLEAGEIRRKADEAAGHLAKARVAAEAEAHTLREDLRQLRADLERREQRLAEREERLDAEALTLEERARELAEIEAEIERKRAKLEDIEEDRRLILERTAGLTAEQAKGEIVSSIENQAKREAAIVVRDIERQASETAEERARKIVTVAIQRVASEQTAESVVSVLHLPSDEMKGRIIGREGRNIRAFESVTGVNLIIDDTPEAVLLSCFDPVRREIGRLTLEALVLDGRIHPHRIEDVYERSKAEVDQLCVRAGEDALVDVGLTDMHPELTALLGRLRYRTSYGQNVLKHLVESAHLAGLMASELRLDPVLLKRCALLHDIGKALTHEVEGSHALVGAEIARRYGEDEEVVHAIEAHHNEVEVRTVEAVLTQAADAISGGRPAGGPRGVHRASGAAGGDRQRAAWGGEGVRHAGRAGGPGHGAAGQGRRHPGPGDRARHRQAGGGGADLSRPDPHHGRARVPRHGSGPVAPRYVRAGVTERSPLLGRKPTPAPQSTRFGRILGE
jgi:ribonucrease Y